MNDSAAHDKLRPFDFRGSAKEWFGIWIVNLLLTICTFGIYSAWAKVRRKKYFYNNTYVEGRNFDYHATGKQILIGRILIVVAIAVFQLASSLNQWLALGLVGIVIFFIPWMVARALMFNARMSSFSNVRFDFVGTPTRAAIPFILLPFFALATFLGLIFGGGYQLANGEPIGALLILLAFPFVVFIYPAIDRQMKRFSVNNHRLGTAEFSLSAGYWLFVGAAFKAALLLILFIAFSGLVLVFLSQVIGGPFAAFVTEVGDEITLEENWWVFLRNYLATLFVGYFTSVFAALIYQALVRNVVYNHTILGGEFRFRSDISAGGIFWIAITNFVAVVATLGLMLPWAQIRLAKYMADHTFGVAGGSLDRFVSVQGEAGMAVGDAYSDIEGLDLGLPI